MVGAFFHGGAIFHANSMKFCPPPYYMNIHGGGIFSRGGAFFHATELNTLGHKTYPFGRELLVCTIRKYVLAEFVLHRTLYYRLILVQRNEYVLTEFYCIRFTIVLFN